MTEKYDTTIPTVGKNVVDTLSLGGIEDLSQICDYVWQTTPQNVIGSTNTGFNDVVWGKLFWRGMDTYELRNQSNETVSLTAYYCIARKDSIFAPGEGDTSTPPHTISNVYNYLGAGLAENGYYANYPSGLNGGLTDDVFTPYMSRLFCRTFKIIKQKRVKIAPGKVLVKKIKAGWHSFTPGDYYQNSGSAQVLWTLRTRMYDHIKGERFILWKLRGSISGVASQVTATKYIAQTTPTVIMKTTRRYEVKHLPKPAAPMVNLIPRGFATGGTAGTIIVDADEQKGSAFNAS